jgi:hypothetical protein
MMDEETAVFSIVPSMRMCVRGGGFKCISKQDTQRNKQKEEKNVQRFNSSEEEEQFFLFNM